MHLSRIVIVGFKSFSKKTTLDVSHNVTGVVGPNGSGKSNVAEAIRFVLGEQSMKSMRGKSGSDLIFKGSQHLPPLSRASVTMIIDNRDKRDISQASEDLAPFLVYDEIVLAREIYGDGTSEYSLNDAKVRLKDVQELLALAGIGTSAHTIINQGDGDRILLSSLKDRKEMIEDALGLRLYHIRLKESQRKLEKVKEHLHEVDLMRKEIAPHIGFLKKQVDKLQTGENERKNLHNLLVTFLSREELEIKKEEENINSGGSSVSLQIIIDSLEKELSKEVATENIQKDNSEEDIFTQRKQEILAKLRALEENKNNLSRVIGRLEAEKSFLEKQNTREEKSKTVNLKRESLNETKDKLDVGLSALEISLLASDISQSKINLADVKYVSNSFFGEFREENNEPDKEIIEAIAKLSTQIIEEEKSFKNFLVSIDELNKELAGLEQKSQEKSREVFEEEKKVLTLNAKLSELRGTVKVQMQKEEMLKEKKSRFESLLAESVAILGKIILDYKNKVNFSEGKREGTLGYYKDDGSKANATREELLRAIERSKLKLEDLGVINAPDIMKEYEETTSRDNYLAKELEDIRSTEEKLLTLIKELEETLTTRFEEGINKISEIFGVYFNEMFPGGKGALIYTKVEGEMDEFGVMGEAQIGVDISVSLPAKKVKELSMLSGGERALTSIALLFAMSSITPPPFMVLDETDAPLDESNARKYGAMLKKLAQKSKLLVITHNRETMNHCDMLYGVTVGAEGGSKLLSIKFNEATAFAK